MRISVKVLEKSEQGDLVLIDDRSWSEGMLAALQHANFVTVRGKEYELLEGRLNVESEYLELLVSTVMDKSE